MRHEIRWTQQKLEQRLALIAPLDYRDRLELPPFRYLELEGPQAELPSLHGASDDGWQTIPWNSHWAGPDTNFCLRTQFRVPARWGDKAPVALYLPIGQAGDFSHPEALVHVDCQPYAACDRHHQEILLPAKWCDGEPHSLALHGWTGGTHDLRFGLTGGAKPLTGNHLFMQPCQVVQIDPPTRDFVSLARVTLEVAQVLDENDPTRAHLYNTLDEAFKVLDTREPGNEAFCASLGPALELLRQGIIRSGQPLDVDMFAAGHAHIDVAWLWTLGQTRHKSARTFHTVLRMMEQFPDYDFSQSQPQLYDHVRQDHPDLFQAIGQRVAEGRWEPLGGMWVEADCNLAGGESLARQLLLGRSFFRKHFGPEADSPILWLPDVFGYAWNLPQLAKEAGLEYFYTTKLGWNQYNRFPYESFWWQGLDGTCILTHFSSTRPRGSKFAGTYNSDLSPYQVQSTWDEFQQKDCGPAGKIPPLLLVYGHGDGGGGPTREMLENLGHLVSFPAVPRTKPGTAIQFFRELEDRVGDQLPAWNGELYLEYHRGTYTTHARNKRANRKSEFLLHDAEFLASLASHLEPAYTYPHGSLGAAWQLVCLNQFHDIIPGSSIGAVYEESLAQYAEVRTLGQGVVQEALAAIGAKVGGDLLLVNPTSFPRRDPALWPGKGFESHSLRTVEGAPVLTQRVDDGLLLDAGELPPYSVTPLVASRERQGKGQIPTSLTVAPNLLENDLLRVELEDGGDIVRIYDKVHRREVLPPGAIANQFQAFEDRPKTPDAWEIDIYYDDVVWLAEPASLVTVVEQGPLRAALEVQRRVSGSDICQRIKLAHNSARLDFETTVQWRERHVMLKVAFPVDVLSPAATYEIQWGSVERPTHRNTSWDWARFEVAAQKWVDLSEGGYGVSLLNDCKYGHDIRDNLMRLTLLRSPTDPDPTADLGEHHFTYSLLPHGGDWRQATAAQAYELNDPSLVWKTERAASGLVSDGPVPFVRSSAAHVIVETVKQAEDGQGYVVRLYESQRRRGKFSLITSFGLAGAWRTNLLEENQARLEVEGNRLRCAIKPFQIMTLRLMPERSIGGDDLG